MQGKGTRFSQAENLRILDYRQQYMEQHAGNKTMLEKTSFHVCEWVKGTFNRQTYDRKSLSQLVQRETDVRKAAKSDVRRRSDNTQGDFPDVELVIWSRAIVARLSGGTVGQPQVRAWGRHAMQELHPGMFNEEGECAFKFSDHWLQRFMDRFDLSFRRATTSNKALLSQVHTHAAITQYHLSMAALQRQGNADPVHGYADGKTVYNRDQTPICLAAPSARTIESRGKQSVLIIGDERDQKRLSTLNLCIVHTIDRDEVSNNGLFCTSSFLHPPLFFL